MSIRSVSAAASAFEEHLRAERRASAHSITAYLADLDGFLGFMTEHLGGTPSVQDVLSLGVSDFRAWLSCLSATGLTARSRARKLSSIKSFYRFLDRAGIGRSAAIAEIKAPKFQKPPPRPVASDAAERLIDEIEVEEEVPWVAARDTAIFLLLYGAGLRISEALSLPISTADGRASLEIVGKGAKVRHVPLLPVIRDALADAKAKLPFVLKPEEPLFRGRKGGVLNPRLVQRRMAALRGRLGLAERATPHALRHAFATDLLKSGADLRVIQELLGHASLSTTQGYTEVEGTHLLAQYAKAHPRA